MCCVCVLPQNKVNDEEMFNERKVNVVLRAKWKL